MAHYVQQPVKRAQISKSSISEINVPVNFDHFLWFTKLCFSTISVTSGGFPVRCAFCVTPQKTCHDMCHITQNTKFYVFVKLQQPWKIRNVQNLQKNWKSANFVENFVYNLCNTCVKLLHNLVTCHKMGRFHLPPVCSWYFTSQVLAISRRWQNDTKTASTAGKTRVCRVCTQVCCRHVTKCDTFLVLTRVKTTKHIPNFGVLHKLHKLCYIFRNFVKFQILTQYDVCWGLDGCDLSKFRNFAKQISCQK